MNNMEQIELVSRLAAEKNLSYGQYIARYGLPSLKDNSVENQNVQKRFNSRNHGNSLR